MSYADGLDGATAVLQTEPRSPCVLVAVDERADSVDLARTARHLFGHDARYVLMNVGTDVPPWSLDPTWWGTVPPAFVLLSPNAHESVVQAQPPTGADRAEMTASNVAASAGLGDAEIVGTAGRDIGVEICAVADAEAVDVIVLGHHHRGWLDRLLSRSVPDCVIREAHRPVLLVP